jgi:hypothetical protein
MNDVGNLGERWTLITVAGDRREYKVIDAPEDGPHAAWMRLCNLDGGGIAHVTRKWLRDSPYTPGGPRWERVDVGA